MLPRLAYVLSARVLLAETKFTDSCIIFLLKSLNHFVNLNS